MDTDSFITHIKTEDVYEDIDIKLCSQQMGLTKHELGGKIMIEFAALRPKAYSYLMDDGNSDKKSKGTKNV